MWAETIDKPDHNGTQGRREYAAEAAEAVSPALQDDWTRAHSDRYQRNIENMIGTVKIPVGVAGPLRINGDHAVGDYQIPLATTEATLVASYHRGCRLITAAGGCRSLLLDEGVRRAPGFAFSDLHQVAQFVAWVRERFPQLQQIAASSTRFGRLAQMHVDIEGNHVYLGFEFTVGDAAGQNMVTIATQAVCDYILARSPVKPRHFFIEANLSGDKKASALSFRSVRGKRLHTSTAQMVEYWRMSAIGGVLSGSIGVQGHYANGLAALYLACGQDVACVAESAVGVTRFELTADENLYAAVTLPSLTVGTVGGGTGLPSQRACLDIMQLAGAGHARAFAEVTAGLLLAGELSIIGALAAGHFTGAHQRFARGA